MKFHCLKNIRHYHFQINHKLKPLNGYINVIPLTVKHFFLNMFFIPYLFR